ncbi:MAG: glycosyltransferase family 2 protein [Fimbriimonadales bacterium]|jgi:glycosyltransferase involved in cell wall biosynthesis|nr:glycosyltransferase family 2 protein [Fimbriimonadales bacterium]GIV13902.1 MAG: hypothetical protein KatS3mg021_2184 [Fimbriimonadales bacterium]CUU34868.1 Glycosyltransferase involved in cell wall bisynthesis [Armatimonadetes bacterium GXS]
MGSTGVSLIVPMHNESPYVEALRDTLPPVLDALGYEWELILVDDGSTDGTAGKLQAWCEADSRVRIIRHPHRLGKTAAYASGFAQAQGQYIFTLDADLQEDPSAMGAMLTMLQQGAGMVVGWRRPRRDGWVKRAASWVFNTLLRWTTGVPLHDINCGFKGMRREVMEALRPYLVRDFHRFLPVLTHRMGYTVAEVVVSHRARQYGRSRYGFGRYWRALCDLVVLWRVMGRCRESSSLRRRA